MNLNQLPAIVKRQIATAREPLNYERAKSAIAECASIDECQDWVDKSAALAAYAKQVRDDSMLNNAKRIRLRASARVGELLLQYPKNVRAVATKRRLGQGRSSATPNFIRSERHEAAAIAGIPRSSTTMYVAMARVPREQREALIEATPPIGANALYRIGALDKRGGINKVSVAWSTIMNKAGWAGNLNAFVTWCSKYEARSLAGQLNTDEAEKLRPHVVAAQEWLDCFEQCLPK